MSFPLAEGEVRQLSTGKVARIVDANGASDPEPVHSSASEHWFEVRVDLSHPRRRAYLELG
jgi:subtilisin-like proprotein convertase family protein